ncbi:ABC transporter permease [Fulvivirga lutimaris]|uniref:ABC transporter permease n=1 Tax=Fulvivirga lutimaris TaxID=1819566 RepID=UPI0012BCF3D1|nr:ABC transporter permease [Fulvivirga lutimaris]MTI38292.1 ABC transporter permease [Fulvivirga lutimaris]
MNKINPPKLPLRFFRWFCNPDFVEDLEGDLFERFERRVEKKSTRSARWGFTKDVIRLFRPGIIKPITQIQHLNQLDMFRNNFKIALRALWKNKPSTVINMVGLTIGITSCLLIALFIQHELSYDKFQPKANRIARVVMEYSFDGSSDSNVGIFTSTKVAPVFSRTFPEVLKGIRMVDASRILLLNNEPVSESGFIYADSSFFDAFYHEMLQGNPATALDGKNKLVLTESMANKYFPGENALGKILEVGIKKTPYEVTGVIRDYPYTSQIRFDFLASFSSLGQNQEETYFRANYTTYLLLNDEHSFASLEEKINPYVEKEMEGSGAKISFSLEHFDKIHLHSPHSDFVQNTSVSYLYILGAVALLILMIVCFTYINLTTAKSIERAKEVGIRKVSGAVRGQLFWQFIVESFTLCLLAIVVSVGLAAILLPSFNQLIDRSLQLSDLYTVNFLLVVVSIAIIISLVAGGYPALVLARMHPAKVLKGVFKNTSSARWLQQSLTIFQFGISVFLIICTLVIQSQLDFIQKTDLGYDRDHVILLPVGWSDSHQSLSTFKQELAKNAQILSVSRTANSPVNIESGYSMRLPTMPENEVIPVNANPVDNNYLEVNGLQLITGTNFTGQQVDATDEEDWDQMVFHYIINESAAKKLGWTPEEAIGQEMVLNKEGIIVGVIQDFNFQSLRNDINPLVLFTATWGGKLLVKVNGNDIPSTLAYIETRWKQFMPDRPFSYHFLDEDYNRLYETELQLSKTMNLFSGIAIILACLGLFGLTSYMIQQRKKEVSIRKVLGASVWSLLNNLSSDFVKLVLLAILIASPIAYFLMQEWLSEFTYRINLPWWAFAMAGLVVVAIAVITAGIHGLKAAIANPVNNLKSE